jgi:HEAT repeat protein
LRQAPAEDIRRYCAEALSGMPIGIDALLRHLDDRPGVVMAALASAHPGVLVSWRKTHDPNRVAARILESLHSENEAERVNAAMAIGALRLVMCVGDLDAAAADPGAQEPVRIAAVKALGEMEDKEAVPPLLAIIRDPDSRSVLVGEAAEALRRLAARPHPVPEAQAALAELDQG